MRSSRKRKFDVGMGMIVTLLLIAIVLPIYFISDKVDDYNSIPIIKESSYAKAKDIEDFTEKDGKVFFNRVKTEKNYCQVTKETTITEGKTIISVELDRENNCTKIHKQ